MKKFGGMVEFHDILNPIFWNEKMELNESVRQKLVKTGLQFHSFLKTPNATISDIIFVGSLCNYNYTKFSDIDLHVVCDFSEYDADIITEYLHDKKTIWNIKYDVKIKGFPVELYAQDISEKLESNGVFSVLHNKWISVPEHMTVDIDDSAVVSKYKQYKKMIMSLYNNEATSIDDINTLKDKIKKLRRSGLENGGEFSVENITFKLLRNSGLLEKLTELQQRVVVSDLQLENQNNLKG